MSALPSANWMRKQPDEHWRPTRSWQHQESQMQPMVERWGYGVVDVQSLADSALMRIGLNVVRRLESVVESELHNF
jgi:hypothetical protein